MANLINTNNLSDVANLVTARSNLNIPATPITTNWSSTAYANTQIGDRAKAFDELERGIICNLERFGLGIDPDGTVVQRALDFASSRARGAVVRLCAKSSWSFVNVTVKDYTCLEGDSGVTITRPNNTTGTMIGVGEGSTIRKLFVNGNKANNTSGGSSFALLGYHKNSALIEDVYVYDNPGIAFGASECQNWIFNRCTAVSSGRASQGFWSDAYSASYYGGGHKFFNCVSQSNELDGIHFGQDDTVIIGGDYSYNGTITNPNNSGALGSSGIYGSDSRVIVCQIEDVKAFGNTEFGINVAGSYGKITNSRCGSNSLSGIAMRPNSARFRIHSNLCLNNGVNSTAANPTLWGKSGIQIDRSGFMHVHDNILFDEGGGTQDYGIHVMLNGQSPYLSIVGNDLRYNAVDADNIRPSSYPGTGAYTPALHYDAASNAT